MHRADELPALLAHLPELAAILPALREAADGAPIWLVGGAVRDVLLDDPGAGLDLDVVVEGDAPAVARRLAAELGGRRVLVHPAFLTATVDVDGRPLDLVTARAEAYPHPGSLPVVRAGALADDLARRDFALNAIAASLAPGALGALVDPHGGAADIRAGVVRALHAGSFTDDATRIVRGARYVARLGFAFDEATAAQAAAAVRAGHVHAVGAERMRDALVLLLREARAVAALRVLDGLGVLAALAPGLHLDDGRAALLGRGAEAAAATADALPWRVLLGLLAALADDPDRLVRELRLPGGDEAAVRAAAAAPALAARLRAAGAGDAIADVLGRLPAEAACAVRALAADGAAGAAAGRWLDELRHLRLAVDGDDLRRELGLAEGPEVGRVLAELRRRLLRGELVDRAEQLAAARALVPDR